jgi:hypothetical protein
MENLAKIKWKNIEVGTVTNISADMWYLEGDWFSNQSEYTSKFEDITSKLKADEIIKSPFKGIVAHIEFEDSNSGSQNVLVLSMEKSKIFIRLINDEIAAYADLSLMEPWQQVVNPTIHENELKKEMSFFHPLNWKKIRAFGFRTDSDGVLFEVLTGRFKYAIVHLSHTKERSRKFPITQFYKDWSILYKTRLLEDNREWNENSKT